MALFNHILVPTDFSDNADAALTVAARIAEEIQATLSVLTVLPSNALRTAIKEGKLAPGDDDASIKAKVTADVEHRLSEFVARIGGGVRNVTLHHAFGDPSLEIADFAAAHGIDLVVMGRRGRTLADVMLGSVAERVIRHASCPVMIVKRSDG
ncbi:MAG TPA: universal stress protein [Blastocatellia bacterium]|nr:universal stress protein [Blastocatellia bacterium]